MSSGIVSASGNQSICQVKSLLLQLRYNAINDNSGLFIAAMDCVHVLFQTALAGIRLCARWQQSAFTQAMDCVHVLFQTALAGVWLCARWQQTAFMAI